MILAINSSTPQFGLSISQPDGTLIAEYYTSAGTGRFGNLVPAFDFMMKSSKLNLDALKCVAVAIGPGSFTGLRVGLSFAKGLCHAMDLPLIGVPSLEALASQCSTSPLPIVPVLDSRKGEFFAAQFSNADDHGLVRKMEDLSLKIEEFPGKFKESVLFIGHDFKKQSRMIKKVLGPLAFFAPAHQWHLKASSVAMISLERFRRNIFDDTPSLDPIYLRPPDIRPNPFSPVSQSP